MFCRREILIRLRVFLGQTPGQSYKLRVHLIEGDTRFEPAHHGRRCVIGSDPQLAARNRRKLIVKRRPKFLRHRKSKIRRHHADDGRRLAIHPNVLSDNVGISIEVAFPDFVTKNRDLLRAWFVVFRVEIAAKNRRDAKNLKEILSDVAAGVTLRIIFVADVDCRSVEVTGHHRERLLRVPQVFVVLRRRDEAQPKVVILIARLWIEQAYRHQLLGMRERKTTQHDSVHNCELRRRGADAEPKYEHSQKAERLVLEQKPQPDANVMKE